MQYLISDVHSRYDLLEPLLDKLGSNFLFLGDCNDSRNPNRGSFLKVLELVQPLIKSKKAVLLHSNHQCNLIAYLQGQRKSRSLKHTITELETIDADQRLELCQWLEALPLTHRFALNGITYSCAHAFYSYKDNYKLTIGPELYQTTIRGPVSKRDGRSRVRWWKWPDSYGHPKQPNHVRVAGHYHECFIGERSIVLDPFGDRNDGVAAYDLLNRKLYLSTESGINVKYINKFMEEG